MVRVDANTMVTDFVCIARPIERSSEPKGGPLRYRVRHEVALCGGRRTAAAAAVGPGRRRRADGATAMGAWKAIAVAVYGHRRLLRGFVADVETCLMLRK